MKDHGLDALVVTALPDILYLTGFTGSHALCVVTRHHAFFLTDSRYGRQSRAEVHGCVRKIVRGDMLEAAVDAGMFARCRTVGFDPEVTTVARFQRLRILLPGSRLKPQTNLVGDLAVVKEVAELVSLRKAIQITERVYRDILGMLKPGVAERDIAAEISYRHKTYGADGDAFEPIVVAGARSAMPHARPSSRRIRAGEMLILDLGCRVRGYGSDLTRTVSVGGLRRRTAQIYRVVLDAHDLALNALRAGMPACELDAVARASIRRAGYGRYFIHSLGHGLGLRVHERPAIGPLSRETLQEGSVVTIEPGVYLPGFGGVRIEDDVLIRSNGCRVLTASSTELTVV